MSKSESVYLHLQKVMIKHSHNLKIPRKDALYWISRLGISKDICKKALEIMREKKLIERVNRDSIRIINTKKSEKINKKLNEILWGEMLK